MQTTNVAQENEYRMTIEQLKAEKQVLANQLEQRKKDEESYTGAFKNKWEEAKRGLEDYEKQIKELQLVQQLSKDESELFQQQIRSLKGTKFRIVFLIDF